MKELEKFYKQWSKKDKDIILHDINGAVRKSDIIIHGLSLLPANAMEIIVDFGCGYGKTLEIFANYYKPHAAYGFDFSETAICYAKEEHEREGLIYYTLPSLQSKENIEYIKGIIGHKATCVLLIDVLEHVPDCKSLMKDLAQITDYFIIKLPIERSVFDNNILKKEYPGSKHSNGHLREFDINTVHYFIRKLGLTPIIESTYIYDIDNTFPPYNRYSWKIRIIKLFKIICSKILPNRIFLRLIGGGGYYCFAQFNEELILDP